MIIVLYEYLVRQATDAIGHISTSVPMCVSCSFMYGKWSLIYSEKIHVYLRLFRRLASIRIIYIREHIRRKLLAVMSCEVIFLNLITIEHTLNFFYLFYEI